MKLHHDYETRSDLDIGEVGLHNYITHPSTKILLLAWAVDDEEPKIWEPHLQPKPPAEFIELLTDPMVTKVAWNVGFERNVAKYKLGSEIPLDEWEDSMIQARYLSMPGSLEDVGKILRLEETAKLEGGKKLIKLFCEPAVEGGEPGLFGISEPKFHDWNTRPKEWELFKRYCRQDVIAERDIQRKMAGFPLPEKEKHYWMMDQRINERGIPVDMELITAASEIVDAEKSRLTQVLKDKTGVVNPNSTKQLLKWVRSQGYSSTSIGKTAIAKSLEDDELTELGEEVLDIRQQTSKSSIYKLESLKAQTSSDGRVRYQFAFMGASRTGRESGSGTQPQNLPRPIKIVESNLDDILEAIRAKDSQKVASYGPILEIVSSCLRSMIKAHKGKLAVADYNAIEPRVAGWVSKCEKILDVFRNNRDIYLDFGESFYGQTYADLQAEVKAGNKQKRQNLKPAVIGGIYRLSGGDILEGPDGETIKTGLLGYAETMGVVLEPDQAKEMIDVFRDTYPEIRDTWYALENTFAEVVQSGKLTQVIRKNAKLNLWMDLKQNVLRIHLPSGRNLHYVRPQVHQETSVWNGREKNVLTYEGLHQKTRKWLRVNTHGGKLMENITQAISRDVLFDGLDRAEQSGANVVLDAHDEIVDENSLTHKQLEEIMTVPPVWAKDLPLAAEGFETIHYRKN